MPEKPDVLYDSVESYQCVCVPFGIDIRFKILCGSDKISECVHDGYDFLCDCMHTYAPQQGKQAFFVQRKRVASSLYLPGTFFGFLHFL